MSNSAPKQVSDQNIDGASFNNVSMKRTVFENVCLVEANFHDVNLSGSTFDDVNLSNVRITHNANLEGMTIRGVKVAELFAAYEKASLALKERQEP